MTEKIEVCNFKLQKTTITISRLTYRQRQYVEAIEQYKAENKKIPSIRTIAFLMGCSSSGSVQGLIYRLKEKGYDYRILNYD